MIKIDVYRNGAGKINAYKVAGHSESAPQGEDIVCAWVSATTQMALIGLDDHLKFPVKYHTDEENGILEVKLEKEPNDFSEALLGSMLCTLKQIEEKCFKYVQVKEHGGENDV